MSLMTEINSDPYLSTNSDVCNNDRKYSDLRKKSSESSEFEHDLQIE